MKELMTTKTMAEMQAQARYEYARKNIDIDAIKMGWKIETGRALHNEAKGITVEIVGEPQKWLYNIHISCPAQNHEQDTQINIKQLADLILRQNYAVYYAR